MIGKSAIPLKAGTNHLTWPARMHSSTFFPGCLLLMMMAAIQCKKSPPLPDMLPPVTQEGKNTFGCKVNGEVWTPYYQCGLINPFSPCKELGSVVSMVDPTNQLPIDLSLTATREIVQGSFSSFKIGARIGQSGNVGSFFVVTYTSDSFSYHPQYPLSNLSNAINVTTIDTVNRIISGTFYFTVYGPAGDSLVITDGRFDIRYHACLCH